MTDKELKRFEKYIHSKAYGCWLWTGHCNALGYGRIKLGSIKTNNRRDELAHRASYLHFVGDIPEGMFVCHKCDNPSCVRSDHLFIGTPADNNMDRTEKGRTRNGGEKHRGEGNGYAVLTEEQAKDILWNYQDHNNKQVAQIFGVHHATISVLRLGRSWKHLDRPERRKYTGNTERGQAGNAAHC